MEMLEMGLLEVQLAMCANRCLVPWLESYGR